MAFCTSCGAEVSGAAFCPKCGAKQGKAASSAPAVTVSSDGLAEKCCGIAVLRRGLGDWNYFSADR